MQSGQFKFDQAGLMKAGPVVLALAAAVGVAYIIYGLWGLLGLFSYAVPIFGGVWYVMTVRKSGGMPEQMNALGNGGILGAVASLVTGVVSLITIPMGANSYLSSLGLGDFGAGLIGSAVASAGIGSIVVGVVIGAVLGAVGAFGYSYLVKGGQVK